MTRIPHRRLRIAVGLMVALMVAAPALAAQWKWPDKARNLKVLPKDTTADQLRATMFAFTRGLGVHCSHCHMGEGHDLSTYDFASDEVEAKNKARTMLKMVQMINADYISKLGDPTPVKVGCITCHHGITRPETIEDTLADTWKSKGIDATINKYRELRATYYGSGAYDFSEHALIGLARTMLQENKADDAIKVLTLNTQMYPRSGITYFYLGEVHRELKQKDEAIKAYEKALEIDPDNQMAKQHLSELKGK